MLSLTFCNSGYCGYLLKSSSHSTPAKRGRMLLTGFHSTMDRPELVSRVTPPRTIMQKANAAQASSHSLSWLLLAVAVMAGDCVLFIPVITAEGEKGKHHQGSHQMVQKHQW